ncbi:hypothetical protein M3B90_03410 [Dermabacter sp. p3-SID358]|uniref:hypothetical protein n=1 Tax=Dermabacter sp. p3-SID358 TaxID=2916114 RepID=UPI0021A6B1EB|nr:hypothetical protein [Dermabacter sp. p3-SID358]MCT1866574.1 hypothetical protein [Dermabacter sp. p3-SID358]
MASYSQQQKKPLRVVGVGCACICAIIALAVVVVGIPVVAVIVNQPKATSIPDHAPITSSKVSEQPSAPDPANPNPNGTGILSPTPGRATEISGEPAEDVLNQRLPDAIGEWQLAHIGTRPVYLRAEQRINVLSITNTDKVGSATAENPALGLDGEQVIERGVCAPHPGGKGGFQCWVWAPDVPKTVLTVETRDASMDDVIAVAKAVRG